MKLDKQSVIDAALAVVGGVIGGVATGAFIVSRWLRTGRATHGTPSATPWLHQQRHGMLEQLPQEGEQ